MNTRIVNGKSNIRSLYIAKIIDNKYMNIKHYIVIRFYCVDMMEKEKLFDNELLNNGVDVFEKYTLKSLENQSNKNFEIILLIHNEIDDSVYPIQRLKSIQSDIKINVIRFSEYKDFISANLDSYDFLITTRMDHDDLIHNNAVKDIQSKCNLSIPLYFEGFDKLITMVNNDYENSCKFYPNYNGNGAINIFQSVILNLKFSHELRYNILSLSHTNGKEKFIGWYVELGCEFNNSYFCINHLEDSSVYVKHEFNHSTYQHELLNKWHRTNIKLNRPKEWFVERFGNFL